MKIKALKRQEKAFIGDALAKFLLADILLVKNNFSMSHVLSMLSNKYMAKCVKELNWNIRDTVIENLSSKRLGTIYELALYDQYKENGIEGAREFIMKTLLKDYDPKEFTLK